MSSRLRIVVAGDVDHGKSTLLGRLMHDTGNLPDGKLEEVRLACERRKVTMEWSFLLDAFQAERDQAVTIDTTQINLGKYILIDTPGHREFICNMISGSTQADAALVIVDATLGVTEQTRDHLAVLSLVGITQFIVAVNKMDLVAYNQDAYERIATHFLIKNALAIPVSAKQGEMTLQHGKNMPWYTGPTLNEALGRLYKPNRERGSLRFAIQDVYRMDGRRIVVGRMEQGTLREGDAVLFSPYNQQAHVKTLEVWPSDVKKTKAEAGECIGITLDRDIFIERGHVASAVADAPKLSPVFQAKIFRVPEKLVQVGDHFTAQIGLITTDVSIQSVEYQQGLVMDVTLKAQTMLAMDTGAKIVLLDDVELVGGGMVDMDAYPDLRRGFPSGSKNISHEDHLIDHDARARRNGHEGAVFWLTGLSGSGKTTLAMAVEKALFEQGMRAYVLDGDNIRHGLAADLGFSPEDRAENIRRAGEVAALMADAGLIVITAFISPYQAGRAKAAQAAGGRFYKVYVDADLEACEARDPKGLYKKARAGKISDFTGIDSPYERPENPDLVIDTVNNSVEDCVQRFMNFIMEKSALSSAGKEKAFALQ